MADDTTKEKDEWSKPYPPKTDDEIRKIAEDIVGGRIFGSWNLRPDETDLLQSVFMLLLFGNERLYAWLNENEILHVYEYLEKAGPRSINGCPMFFSCHMLSKSDARKVFELVNRMREAMKAVTA